ncbi:hypothetical protein VTI74DRAFT_10055 [Chaetomium olivicolor]
MPWLNEVSYSRDATVKAIREYYGFLVKMYLKESYILEPPEGGWPLTDPEGFGQALGKTNEVVELLRHLPYIPFNKAHGAAGCWFADWRYYMSHHNTGRECFDGVRSTTENGIRREEMSPHVIGLTDGGRYTPAFLLDTERGVVYWVGFYECDDEIKNNPNWERIQDDAYDYAPRNEADWRAEGIAWAIPDFFENLKDQFRHLVFAPICSCTVYWADQVEGVQDIYREHGWPDLDRYRKKDCLKAVRAFVKERYDCADHGDSEDEEDGEEAPDSSPRAGPLVATP